jgi:hypothetical protein
MTPVELGSWIRNPRRNLGFALAYAALLAWFAVMLLYVAGRLGTEGVEGVVWLGTASFLFAMASLTARLMIGWARAGLLFRDDLVVVRGPWTTRRLSRAWVERFEAGMQHTALGNPTPGVVISLGDGSAVNVAALATESMVWSSERKVGRWEATALALNELLTKARN